MADAAVAGRRAVLAGIAWLACQSAIANIAIEVNGVDGDIKRNVLTYLSLQRYASAKDLAADTVERIGRRVPLEAKAALRPFGFYEPKITYTLTREGNDWRAKIDIERGPPVIVREIDFRITGPGSADAFFTQVIARSTLKVGDPLDHSAYEKVKGELERTAASFGYLDAKLERHELVVDPPSRSASAHLLLSTGPRYRFGGTTIKQHVIDDALMRKYIRYKEGDFYDATALLRTQFALDDSQYFRNLEVLPGEHNAADLTVPVSISGAANKRNRYSFGGGYGTDTRFRGTLAWDDRLINEQGHRSHLQLQASSIEQQLNAAYIIPVGDPALEKFSIESTYGRTIVGDLTENGGAFKTTLTQVFSGWQRAVYVSYVRSVNRTTHTEQADSLAIPGISFASVPAGFNGQPLTGRGLYAELTASAIALGAHANFVRLLVQDDQRFKLSPLWYFLLRGQFGVTFGAGSLELPASQRFFAGGDRSVRGFALNTLSPVNQFGEKTGGRDLIVGSAEIERQLRGNFAVATFIDAGNAENALTVPLAYAAGVGVRYKLAAISIGLDVAKAISPSGLGPRLHLNIQPTF